MADYVARGSETQLHSISHLHPNSFDETKYKERLDGKDESNDHDTRNTRLLD